MGGRKMVKSAQGVDPLEYREVVETHFKEAEAMNKKVKKSKGGGFLQFVDEDLKKNKVLETKIATLYYTAAKDDAYIPELWDFTEDIFVKLLDRNAAPPDDLKLLKWALNKVLTRTDSNQQHRAPTS